VYTSQDPRKIRIFKNNINIDIPSTKHTNVVSNMDCEPSDMVIEPIKQGGVVPPT
jgi:hypothetical protein